MHKPKYIIKASVVTITTFFEEALAVLIIYSDGSSKLITL